MPTLQDVKTWRGRDVVGPDGEKVGTLDHIYLDRQTGEPTFGAVKTGLFGTKVNLVPLEGATGGDEQVRLAFDKQKIKDAPNIDADAEISEAEEQRLYEYYGVGDSSFDDEIRDPGPGHHSSGPTADEAMTGSEEGLRVGKTPAETSRARLRRYVVTETVQTTVPALRGEARIEREPITEADTDRTH